MSYEQVKFYIKFVGEAKTLQIAKIKNCLNDYYFYLDMMRRDNLKFLYDSYDESRNHKRIYASHICLQDA